MEDVQSLLAWEQAGTDDRDLPNSCTTRTAHAVVSMATCVLQVVVGLNDTKASWSTNSHCHSTLLLRVCFHADDIIAFEVLGVDHTVAVWIALLVSESGAG